MKAIILLGLLLSLGSFAESGVSLEPLIGPSDTVIFRGNVNDVVTCGSEVYRDHIYSILVTQDKTPCDCTSERPKKIYIDGELAGTCKSEIKTLIADQDTNSFIDFDLLKDLSDKEVIKLFSAKVGSCSTYGQNLQINKQYYSGDSSKVGKLYKVYLNEAKYETSADDTQEEKVIALALRNIVKDGHCGTFDKAAVNKHQKHSRKIIGTLDIGFEYFINKGLEAEELAEMHYPLKKFLSKFNLSIQELKKSSYTYGEMVDSGIQLKDIISLNISLKALVTDGVNPKSLKPYFVASDFKVAGYGVYTAKQAGYTRGEAAAAGFTEAELKDAGY